MFSAIDSGLTIDQLRSLANAPQQTLAQIVAVLQALSGSVEAAQWAGEALENCGVPPASAAVSIAQHTEHPDELVASWACKLLARLGRDGATAEKQLVCALTTRQELLVREEAARALGQLGTLSESARTALTAAAQQGGPRLKRLATASLGG
jgi:HEAT repeats